MSYRQPFHGEWPITQKYGEAITSPFHTGIDYGCPMQTPILASEDGQVMASGWDLTGYGFRVIIRHSADRATLYAHLDAIDVSTGEHVTQGQQIGLSGRSGNVTGPHLHFEARSQWGNSKSHFDPMRLPLMSVDDTAATQPADQLQRPEISAGFVRIVCDLPANVRNTYDHRIINGQKYKGETFEITAGTLMINGLPYHRIVPHYVSDLGGLIAEYDSYGTQILEQAA